MSSGSNLNGSVRSASVAAVVVTYNRKELLGRCLKAVLAQSRPVDKLIVVDNCSTDGTPEFLRGQGFLGNGVIEYLRLAENGGSAGGFYEGMKRAYEQGYEWLWSMDDDGMPLPDTLARLLGCSPRILFRGCVVLSSDDPSGDKLAFGLETPSGAIRRVSELSCADLHNGIFEGSANPYNGVLISREVIGRMGLPKKELFIWGDEIEYLLRAKDSGVPIATVLSAEFLHPPDRMLLRRVRLGPLSFALPYSNDPFRFYLIVRNNTYISLRYQGMMDKRFLKLVAYPFVFPRRMGLILRAWAEGLTGRLTLENPRVG